MHHINYTLGDIVYNPTSGRYFMIIRKHADGNTYQMAVLAGGPLIGGVTKVDIGRTSLDARYRKVA